MAQMLGLASVIYFSPVCTIIVEYRTSPNIMYISVFFYFSPVCTFIVEYRTSPAQMLGLARGLSPTKHETGKSSHQVAPPLDPSPNAEPEKYILRYMTHTL